MWEPFADQDSLERITQAVRKAPSVFGSKPWSLQVVAGDRIEMRAVPCAGGHGVWTAPAASEPLAREFSIGCGTALYNLQLAIRVAGHDMVEWLLPDPEGDPGLLASVEIVTARTRRPSVADEEMYEAIWLRHTSRYPFAAPVPLPLIVAMESAAASEHTRLRLMHRTETKAWLRAVAAADEWLATDNSPRTVAFRSRRDLLLSLARPARGPAPQKGSPVVTRADFWLPGEKARFERRPQLMSLSTGDDRPLDWLRAGRALQRAVLTATRYSMSVKYAMQTADGTGRWSGVAASFLTQPLEADDIRSVRRTFPWRTWSWYGEVPQMVLRVGYSAVVGQPQAWSA